MPVIDAGSPEVARLKGLHLYHYGLSNCSQRVRLMLEEKRLRWTSHPVDLSRNRHATAAYHRVNPRGLVPALVHDGRVVIESLDILDYLEAEFPEPRLAPEAGAETVAAASLGRLADRVQPALKLLSHEFLFKSVRRLRGERLDAFAAAHADPSLVAFLREFAAPDGFTVERIAAAVADMNDAFIQLDAALRQSDWLAGPRITLADIAWMPNLRRMALMRFPLEHRPALLRWYGRARARPSFRAALIRHEPMPARVLFALYGVFRRVSGSDVRSFAPRMAVA